MALKKKTAKAKKTPARKTKPAAGRSGPRKAPVKKKAKRAVQKKSRVIVLNRGENHLGIDAPERLIAGAEKDDLAEELGENFVVSATSGENAIEDIRNADVPEDEGGPFVQTSAKQELSFEDDEPEDAEAAPLPTANRMED